MSTDRIKRINALLHREIGEALYKVMAGETIDLSCVMISRVETAPNLRHARVFVSISHADEQTRHRIFSALLRHRADLQRLINRDLKIKYTPRLEFINDSSVEAGDHILDVLNRMDVPGADFDYGIDPDTYESGVEGEHS